MFISGIIIKVITFKALKIIKSFKDNATEAF